MKKVTIRIFLSIFVLWFFSLWLNVVYGQTSCVTSPYSSNSSNGSSYTNTLTIDSQETWYINKNTTINAICAWNPDCRNYVCNTFTQPYDTEGRKAFCNNNMAGLFEKQLNLRQKFNSSKDNIRDSSWDTPSIGNLQTLMWEANCPTEIDCKVWVKTSHSFLFCPICEKLDSDRKDTNSEGHCEDIWYTLTGDNLCCMPTPECVAPIVKINWEENKTTYNEEESLEIVIDYSNNEWEINFPDNLNDMVVIDPGSALISEIVKTSKTITFSLSTEWTNSISISIEDELVKLGTKQCSWINITLEREVPCQNVNERQQCSNSDDFDAPAEPITDYSFLEKKICNKNWTGIEFCPCKTPPENDNCNKYWTGRYLKDDCCNKCPSNKKVNEEWDDCVCTTPSSCNQSWYVFNDETCKCECDPTQRCCGILLNTVVPFIGDCIEMTTQNSISDPSDPNKSRVNQLNAFPFLMMWLSKILVTIILIFSFLIIIAAWLMMTTGVYKEQNYKTWVDRITKVIVWLILLWASGLILRLINPSFFGW